MKKTLKKIYILLSMSLWLNAGQDIQLKKGNLALPTSQQPNPIFSFGQNIDNKGDVQLFFFTEYLKGPFSKYSELIPSFLYGVTDDFSLYISIPVATKLQKNNCNNPGFEAISLQLEYAYYTYENENYTTQATIVAFATLPSNAPQNIPDTGLGTPGFFIGATLSNTATLWYSYISPGFVFSTQKNGSRAGSQFLYQFGLGRNVPSPKGSIMAIVWEFNGVYAQKDLRCDQINNLSGGNIFYTGPSFFFSTQRFTFQAGAAWPVVQDFNDPADTVSYLIGFNVGWKFN